MLLVLRAMNAYAYYFAENPSLLNDNQQIKSAYKYIFDDYFLKSLKLIFPIRYNLLGDTFSIDPFLIRNSSEPISQEEIEAFEESCIKIKRNQTVEGYVNYWRRNLVGF